ncbi:putative betaine--homocysteine S-methyltransferase 1 [Apostichopus japonicus]|uniref:Putative betaine--homocysteine S-methyltransferase 1 n=1 Tax=Stichopus japonicus TaxID=307972 RepID=A0A2G8LBA3_STIJA|nr:putative betaine--homocysteine S-methyltransferase 1 [Apostichopus japonicus]
MNEFQKQIDVFKDENLDFLLGEFFGHVEEAEMAIEAMKQLNIPIACTMKIGPAGDLSLPHKSPQECAVRMAKAGADIIGINCSFGPFVALETIGMMKEALDAEGLSPYLMAQPAGWYTSEVRNDVMGYVSLPEMPFAMETRTISRMDAGRFAREAYKLGVRYIGGCCGCEPYHIRAMAEELAQERGRPSTIIYDRMGQSPSTLKERCTREYWENVIPAAGRTNVKILADLDDRR